MHAHAIDEWRHEHVFLGADHERNARRTWAVVGLTITTAEIAGGLLWGSTAFIADSERDADRNHHLRWTTTRPR